MLFSCFTYVQYLPTAKFTNKIHLLQIMKLLNKLNNAKHSKYRININPVHLEKNGVTCISFTQYKMVYTK